MGLLFVNYCLFCRVRVEAGVGTFDGFVNMGARARSWIVFLNLGVGAGSSLCLIL